MTERKSIYYTSTVSNDKIIVNSFVTENTFYCRFKAEIVNNALERQNYEVLMCTSYM